MPEASVVLGPRNIFKQKSGTNQNQLATLQIVVTVVARQMKTSAVVFIKDVNRLPTVTSFCDRVNHANKT
jgi:hypothetical protein